MRNDVVRILSVELKNVKNTKIGQVKTPMCVQKDIFSTKGDILGIYGQNGSGKTAVIEAMAIVQCLLREKSLPADTVHYIAKDAEECTIAVTFAVQSETIKSTVVYTLNLVRQGNDKAIIRKESIEYKLWNGEKLGTLNRLHVMATEDKITVLPQTRYKEIINTDKTVKTDLLVAHKLAQSQATSYFFSKEAMKIWGKQNAYEFSHLLVALRGYALANLFVVTNDNAGYISSSLALPMTFHLESENHIDRGAIGIPLNKPSVLPEEQYEVATSVFRHMNTVLREIIPGLTIEVHDFGPQLTDDGREGHRIELLSHRGDIVIPLRCESEGILKIISVLHVLMCIYKHPQVTVLIDELDAGIYEYLLGELLSIFEKGAKGQLIFTSHNLRALEMLHKNSIIFSTTNPENRYVRIHNVKASHNLRDTYLRTIFLGGATEDLYTRTDNAAIRRAFYQAGE